MHDRVLIRRYTLDHAGIMFVTDLIRDANISDTALKYHSTRNGRNLYINIFGNWKNATMQEWWFGSVTTFYKQSDHTNIYSTFRTVLCPKNISYIHSAWSGKKEVPVLIRPPPI